MMGDGSEFTGFGVGIKNGPRWALGALMVAVGIWLLAPTVLRIVEPERALVSERAANEALRAKMAEVQRHLGEPPAFSAAVLDDPARGRIVVSSYPDRCVGIAAWDAAGAFVGSTLVVDLLGDPDRVTAAGWPGEAVLAAAGASRCDGVAHGEVVASAAEARRGACEVLWRSTFRDGCVERHWVDACHGLFGPYEWLVCRH